MQVIGNHEIEQRLSESLPKWQRNGDTICRTFATSGWPGTLMVVNTVAYLAEAAWHHPDLQVSYKNVTVALTTHSSSGITERDLELALKIEETVMWRSSLPENGQSSML